jgi:hypothetical protein
MRAKRDWQFMSVHAGNQTMKRPMAFWILIVFMSASVVLLLLGQTMAVFNYGFAVSLGMQEDVSEVGEFGVEFNRAFGASDTLVYIPLMVLSIIGLCSRKSWALLTSASVMGISSYWATTAAFAYWFLPGVPNYSFVPGLDYWMFIASFVVFGTWGLWYLIVRGERLIGRVG